MDWIWYLFRFDGRINRALLWQALLIVMMLACMVGMIDQAIKVLNGAATFAFNFKFDFDFGVDDIFNVVDPRAYRLLATTDRPTLILKVLGSSLFLWIYLATATKRLHDRDRSGWWLVRSSSCPRCSTNSRTCCRPNQTGLLPSPGPCTFRGFGAWSKCSLSPAPQGTTGSAPIPWPTLKMALRLPHHPRKAGTSRARSNLSRPVLAHPAACMLSGAHDRCSLDCPRSHPLPIGNPGRCRGAGRARKSPRRGRLHMPPRDLQRARYRRRRQSLCADRH